MTRKRVLALSLAVIAASCGHTIWKAANTSFVAPAQFSTLVRDIVIRKSIVLAVVLALLWAAGETLRTLGFLRTVAAPSWISAIGVGPGLKSRRAMRSPMCSE